MLTLTEVAKKRFVEVITAEGRAGHGLRIIIRNGGTSQPDFALNFVEPGGAAENDTVIDAGDFSIYVDAESVKYLEGASVDFRSPASRSMRPTPEYPGPRDLSPRP